MLNWPIFSVFTFSLHTLYILIYIWELELKAERGSVKFMLNFWELEAGKKITLSQLNEIAQGRETTYKTLLLMLNFRKEELGLSLCLSYYPQRTTSQYGNEQKTFACDTLFLSPFFIYIITKDYDLINTKNKTK